MLIRLSPIDTEAIIPCVSSLCNRTILHSPDFDELNTGLRVDAVSAK